MYHTYDKKKKKKEKAGAGAAEEWGGWVESVTVLFFPSASAPGFNCKVQKVKWLRYMIVLEETGVSAGDGGGVGAGNGMTGGGRGAEIGVERWQAVRVVSGCGGGVDPDCVHVEVTDRSPQRCTPGSNR